MNIKHPALMAVAIPLFPLLAHAENTGSGDSSALSTLFWSVLPIIILVLVFFWFLRRIQGPRMKQYEQYRVRHEQHMERVEQTLDRIAKSLEKKD